MRFVFRAIAGAALLAACSGIRSPKDVQETAARGDFKALHKVCSTWNEGKFDDTWRAACDAYGNYEAKTIYNVDCEAVTQEWHHWAAGEGFPFDAAANRVKDRYDDRTRVFFDVQRSAAKRVAHCEKWDFLFEDMIDSLNEKLGPKILKDLRADGEKVDDGLKTYLSKPNHLSNRAVKAIFIYFAEVKAEGYCATLSAAFDKCAEDVAMEVMIYFAQAKCTEGLDLCERMLSATDRTVRVQACTTLGTIGDKESLARLDNTAKYDVAFEMKGGTKTYPVQDSCRTSAEQVRARIAETEPKSNPKNPKKTK